MGGILIVRHDGDILGDILIDGGEQKPGAEGLFHAKTARCVLQGGGDWKVVHGIK